METGRPQSRHSVDRPATPVVTAFVWDGRRILLALRSESVSTFPGHWAGISGYLEGDDPCAWAIVEVGQECGVARTRLTLRSVGEPLDAEDESTGRTFRVHPFLFSIDNPHGVRSDWEASRFEWVAVEEMRQRRRRPAVPKLYDAFDRVWPPWPVPQALEANLDLASRWLRRDRSMGAGTLARAAAGEVVKLVQLAAESDFAGLRPWLAKAAHKLQTIRPSMTPPANLLADVLASLEKGNSAAAVVATAKELIQRSEWAEAGVARQAAARIGPGARIMTISYSSTVLRTLEAAAPRVQHVYACEGRPLFEGRRLAAQLAERGFRVTLLTDAQAGTFMSHVDRVLLGADSVLPDHAVVNKVGSALLALAAQTLGKPVTVVAESLKFVRDAKLHELPPEDNPSEEVWENPPQGVDVANTYFETLPADCIDEIITEQGPLASSR